MEIYFPFNDFLTIILAYELITINFELYLKNQSIFTILLTFR